MLEKAKKFFIENEMEVLIAMLLLSGFVISNQVGYIVGMNSAKQILPKNLTIETLSDGRMLINGHLFEKIVK
jgi:hypothetical protein